MFDLDKWQEILSTIRTNRLRTALTSFAVAWGIFMLIILLGSGTGLENGVTQEFKADALNSIWVSGGRTSIPHNGLKTDRNIFFDNSDFDLIKKTAKEAENLSSRINFWTITNITYKGKFGTFDVKACHPLHVNVEKAMILEGRFLNDIDVQKTRKVTTIGEIVKDALFGDEEAIGKYININGIPFKVIGVFKDAGSEQETRRVYIPISTGQRVFSNYDRVDQVVFTTGDVSMEESKYIEENVRGELASKHNFSIKDQRAVHINNSMERFMVFKNIFIGIRVFIWIVGIGSILAGIIGISNIMLITVKERTKEIGIRKAMGATPISVIGLIIQESVFITSVAGYIGMFMGIGLIELIKSVMPPTEFFQNPDVDISIVISAVVILITTGALAGLIPAMRAARIKPVVALQDS